MGQSIMETVSAPLERQMACALPHHHLIRAMRMRYVWVRGTLWNGAMSNTMGWCDSSYMENNTFMDSLIAMKPQEKKQRKRVTELW